MSISTTSGFKAKVFLLLAIALGLPACVTLPSQTKCKTYIASYPQHEDANISHYILQRWLRVADKKLKKCEKLVPFDKSQDIFELLGATPEKPLQPADLNEPKRKILYRQTGATHIVFFEHAPDKKRKFWIVRSKVYSLLDKDPKPEEDFPRGQLPYAEVMRQKLSGLGKLAKFSLGLLPNSFAMGYSVFFLTNERFIDRDKRTYDEEKVSAKSETPKFISAMTLTGVAHPYQFDAIDFDFDMFFNLVLLNSDSHYQYTSYDETDETITDQVEYDLALLGGGPMFNINLGLVIKDVRLYFEIGIGPGYIQAQDSLGTNVSQWIGMYKQGFGLIWFITDRFFFRTAQEGILLSPRFIDNAVFQSSMNLYQFYGFGYYFGKVGP